MVSQNFFWCSQSLTKHILVFKEIYFEASFHCVHTFYKCKPWGPFGKRLHIFWHPFLTVTHCISLVADPGENWQPIIGGGDTFFHQKKFLKKPNTSECAQVLVVTLVKLDCVEALLSPPPTAIMMK